MTNIVIGVGGRLTAGKDVFADRLVEQHGFVKLGMSDTLAEALYRLNPWIDIGEDGLARYQTLVDFEGYVSAKRYPEVRRLLQVLGTEVGRELLGENIWVDAARRRITEQLELGNNVVITGIRFPNELELFEYWEDDDFVAATTVWVDRPSLPAGDTHASENSISPEDFEYQLLNDSTLEALEERSDALLEEIRVDYL